MRAFLLALGLAASVALSAADLSNRPAPSFTLQDTVGNRHSLSDYRGQIVLIDMMRTTCPHCITFSRTLQDVERRYAGRVKVLQMIHPPDTSVEAKQYLADHGLQTTMLFGSVPVTAAYLDLSPTNPSFATPYLFVIDQKGWIRENYGYSPLNSSIFEGDGIYAIVEKYLSAE